MWEKASRLYVQGVDDVSVGMYLERWVRSGVDGVIESVGVMGFVPLPILRR